MTIDMNRKLPRPDGHHTVTPAFVVTNAGHVLEFLIKAFDAKIVDRYDGPGGAVMHAEAMVGDSVVMFGEPMEGWGPMPAALSYYVPNGAAVDATYKRALDCGATSISAPTNQPWGYRAASVRDVGGNKWTICAVIEQLSHDEIVRRMSGGK